jgi:putative MATE family efflux protein
MSDVKFLETQKISSLLLKFAIPSIIGLLSHALYNVCDRIFVGQGVGMLGLSGVTVVFPIIMVRFAFTVLVGAGTGTLISIYLGEKNKEKAEEILGVSLFLMFLLGVIFTYLGVFCAEPLLRFFGVGETILPYAIPYMQVLFSGVIFMFSHFALYCAIRSDGKPNFAMAMICIPSVLNVIFDYVFIFHFDMGIRGAAFATVFAEIIEFFIGLYYFLSGRSFIKLRLRYLLPNMDSVKKILQIGFPPFLVELTFGLQNLFLNVQLLKYGGDVAVAAMGIVFAAVIFVILPVIGVCDGMQPIVGYNFGAKQIGRIKETLKLTLLYSTLMAILGEAIIQIFPEQIASLFADDAELLKVSKIGLMVYMSGVFAAGIQNSLGSYLPCIKKASQATMYSLVRQTVIYLGTLYILPKYFGLMGVWGTMPVADILSASVALIWFRYEFKQLDKMKEK